MTEARPELDAAMERVAVAMGASIYLNRLRFARMSPEQQQEYLRVIEAMAAYLKPYLGSPAPESPA